MLNVIFIVLIIQVIEAKVKFVLSNMLVNLNSALSNQMIEPTFIALEVLYSMEH